MLRNKLLAMAALIMGFLLPAQAMAAYEAYTRVDLNLRVGPDITYGVIDVIPYGEPVLVLGCLDQYYWCDVEWYGLRGWVAAEYLVQPGTSVYLPRIAPQIGLPIVVFSFNTYHDRYYRDRPWYKQRYGRWQGHKWRRDRDRDRDRERADRDRPREGERTQRRRPSQQVERPRERREVERPRQRQQVERPRQRREVERPRQRQEVERPRQRQESQRPRQRREVERPRQRQETQRVRQSQKTQRVRQSQKSERPRQRSEQSAEKPRKGERKQRKLPPE